ncbi:MAG: hypothetical protein MK132_01485 [Lentisphaerales bacterium]|nr:hypothetical protein [Lentisphaerales bacterium]
MHNKILRFSAIALLIASLPSCNDAQAVRTIDVKLENNTSEPVKEEKMKGLPEGSNLILGVIIPTSSSQWFVKLAGPSSEFNEVKDLLDRIIDTIDFDDYSVEVVKLDVPEGWVQKREKGFLHSSITKEGLKSRVTISKASGTVLDNVNRWNRQLGNGMMDERQLMQVSQKQVINGRFGILVVLAKHDGSTGRELQQSQDPHHGHDHFKNPHGDTAALNDAKGIRIAFADVNGQTWYIKLTGSANTLITEKANFEAFVNSFKFEGRSASWKAPASWKSLGAGGMIKESFDAGGAKATIVTLPVGGGTLESNVNRWRGQIGLSPTSLEQINKQMQQLEFSGVKYKYLFISGGSQAAKPKAEAPQAASSPGGSTSQSGISFTLPEGWTTVAASGMRKVNLLVDGIPVTGISLGAAAKGLKKNVDRWCGQIDMKIPSEDELAAMTEKIDFSGGKADLVVLKGKEKSILALVFDEKDSVWFFKAMGETVKILKQKDNFSAFVKSVKLPGGGQ